MPNLQLQNVLSPETNLPKMVPQGLFVSNHPFPTLQKNSTPTTVFAHPTLPQVHFSGV
jgi:hypothetical protein